MFDYLRSYSSNAHQVCCEESPTKGLHKYFQCNDIDLHSRSQVRLKLYYFLTCSMSDNNYLSYYIQTWHRLTHGIYAHNACFGDLELDPDFENVCSCSLF